MISKHHLSIAKTSPCPAILTYAYKTLILNKMEWSINLRHLGCKCNKTWSAKV